MRTSAGVVVMLYVGNTTGRQAESIIVFRRTVGTSSLSEWHVCTCMCAPEVICVVLQGSGKYTLGRSHCYG